MTDKFNEHKDAIVEDKSALTKPVEDLLGDILAPDTETVGTDNMTCMMIYFNKNMGFESKWVNVIY